MSPLFLRVRRRELRFGPPRWAMSPLLLSPAVDCRYALFFKARVIMLHDHLRAEIIVAWLGRRDDADRIGARLGGLPGIPGLFIIESTVGHSDKVPGPLIDETRFGLRKELLEGRDGGHELVTPAGNSPNVPFVFWTLTERLSQDANLLIKVVVHNESAVPGLLAKIL